MNSGIRFAVASTPRDAMNLAYKLHDQLPLSTAALVTFDLAAALGKPEALAVVAEQIFRVPDHNRPPYRRVDFFCYMPNGDVVRYHPGRTQREDMQPHHMPQGTALFNMRHACQRGVGAVLHRQPPALVRNAGALQPGVQNAGALQPRVPLCTRDDMNSLCIYDIQSINWRQVRRILDSLGNEDAEFDWNSGDTFAWWVWLANTGARWGMVGEGVFEVRATVSAGAGAVEVTSTNGRFRITARGRDGKMTIEEI